MKNYLLLLSVFIPFLNFAQISGTVKDQSGNPIAHALVSLSNDVQVYTHTKEDGSFELPGGNAQSKLRIAALKYETIRSTSARAIILERDPLLDTDEYHISFDHMRPLESYTQEHLFDDFPIRYSKGFREEGQARGSYNDRASVDYNESIDPGGVSLKVTYPANALKTEFSGVDLRIPLMNTFKDNYYESYDLYLSYWLKFDDDFDFDLCGGKLPSLGGSDKNVPGGERGNNRWKGRIMFRKGGSIQFYMELPGDQSNDEPDDDQNDLRFWGPKVVPGNRICEFQYENYLRPQGWHNIELHYKFETPGQNDGLFEGWVDGENYDFVNATFFNNYRSEGRENITINHILLSTFLGGSSSDYEPGKDYNIWFDEFRVSKTRINEWESYMNPLSVDENPNQVENAAYPNPSTGIFTLARASNWSVFDILGNLIQKGSGKVINLSGNADGMYFIKTEESTQLSKLMLK